MPTWSRKLATTHLEHLAASRDIEIIWLTGDWKEALAFRASRTVKIPRPYNARLYLIGLHEFGHLLSPTARRLWGRDEPDTSTACEGAAWGWAFGAVHPKLAHRILNRDLTQLNVGLVHHASCLVRARRKGRVE